MVISFTVSLIVKVGCMISLMMVMDEMIQIGSDNMDSMVSNTLVLVRLGIKSPMPLRIP
jgi:hypothetical protein